MASPLVRPPLPSAAVQEVGGLDGSSASPALHVRSSASASAAGASLFPLWRERGVRVLGPATSCSRRRQWEVVTSTCSSAGKVTCLGGWKKRDAARKALEDALDGKKEVVEKWNQEIKKRQESGGSKGRGRGKGWGGGGGGGGRGKGSGGEEGGEIDPDAGNRWEEAKQFAYAFFGLVSVYLILTQGKAMLAIAVNVLFFVLRGFKRSPSYRPPPRKTEAATTPSLGPLALGNAEADVISKWGKD